MKTNGFLTNKKPILISVGFLTTFLGACNLEELDKLLSKDIQDGSISSENLVEQDVEMPDIFQVSEMAVWDGRPSLGGVWVAHPDVKMPERVIIEMGAKNRFVIGTLFRTERKSPYPRIQVSSEAASALGLIENSPVKLTLTALRKQMVEPSPSSTFNKKRKQNSKKVVNGINKPNGKNPLAKEFFAEITAKIKKSFIQLGIFSIKKNANKAGIRMREMGFIPIIKEQKIKNKIYWRVIVGPVNSLEERKLLLKRIISAGFEDAYAVKH